MSTSKNNRAKTTTQCGVLLRLKNQYAELISSSLINKTSDTYDFILVLGDSINAVQGSFEIFEELNSISTGLGGESLVTIATELTWGYVLKISYKRK
jgi:hypothetical protein